MTRGPTLPAHRLPYLPTPLDAFNTARADEARALLLHCLRSRRWSDRIADHRPYPDLDALLAAADEATYDLPRPTWPRPWPASPSRSFPRTPTRRPTWP